MSPGPLSRSLAHRSWLSRPAQAHAARAAPAPVAQFSYVTMGTLATARTRRHPRSCASTRRVGDSRPSRISGRRPGCQATERVALPSRDRSDQGQESRDRRSGRRAGPATRPRGMREPQAPLSPHDARGTRPTSQDDRHDHPHPQAAAGTARQSGRPWNRPGAIQGTARRHARLACVGSRDSSGNPRVDCAEALPECDFTRDCWIRARLS